MVLIWLRRDGSRVIEPIQATRHRPMSPRVPSRPLALVLAALVIAGCGESDANDGAKREIEAAIRGYLAAVADRNGRRA